MFRSPQICVQTASVVVFQPTSYSEIKRDRKTRKREDNTSIHIVKNNVGCTQ